MSTRPALIYTCDVDRQYITRPMDRSFIRQILLLILFIVPLVVLTLLIIQTNNRIFQVGKQIRYLEYQKSRLEDERLSLMLEKEKLLKPDEVVRQAGARGLAPLTPSQVKTLYVE
jgi:cell division protein FtsL